jgi:hypothetical protein
MTMSLPEGLQFPHLGWCVVHAAGILLVYSFGLAKGRGEERRAQRIREIEKGSR